MKHQINSEIKETSKITFSIILILTLLLYLLPYTLSTLYHFWQEIGIKNAASISFIIVHEKYIFVSYGRRSKNRNICLINQENIMPRTIKCVIAVENSFNIFPYFLMKKLDKDKVKDYIFILKKWNKIFENGISRCISFCLNFIYEHVE